MPVGDSKALKEQLTQEKVTYTETQSERDTHVMIHLLMLTIAFSHFVNLQKLLEEIDKNKGQVEDCQKNAKAYINSVKVQEILTLFEK